MSFDGLSFFPCRIVLGDELGNRSSMGYCLIGIQTTFYHQIRKVKLNNEEIEDWKLNCSL